MDMVDMRTLTSATWLPNCASIFLPDNITDDSNTCFAGFDNLFVCNLFNFTHKPSILPKHCISHSNLS